MKMKTATLSAMGFFLIFLEQGTWIRSQPRAEDAGRMEAMEKLLREADVVEIDKERLGGRTNPWLVTLSHGTVRTRAIFRHVDRRRPHPTPDSFQYDLAAYSLSKLLGIEMIPPVVERRIQGREGSLQVFLENCIREKDRKRKKLEPPDPQAFSKDLEGTRVFENLVYDECQDTDDLYVHREDWRVCRVDFSEAFAPMLELLPGCRLTCCSRALYDGLLKLDEEAAKAELGRYLSEEEIGALFFRKGLITDKIKSLIAEKGEEAVLF
jgi:hypothetical protein